MYYVGIDIAKYKHDCIVINDKHRVIKKSFTFSNDSSGFNSLLTVLTKLKAKSKIKIGFESTGHYATNLKVFLSSHKFTFMEFNPVLIRKFISTQSLRKTKTDKIDCEFIANYLMTVEYKPYPNRFYNIYSLKSLVRLYDSLIRNDLDKKLLLQLDFLLFINMLKKNLKKKKNFFQEIYNQLEEHLDL